MATENALEVMMIKPENSMFECCDYCGRQIENKVGCHYSCQCGYQTGCGD